MPSTSSPANPSSVAPHEGPLSWPAPGPGWEPEGGRLELLEELARWTAPRRPQHPWRGEAACQDLPTDLFFPVGHGPGAQAQAGLAKQVCADCAVREECLDYALAANARYGVFGGMDEDERRLLRRRLRATNDRFAEAGEEDDLEESA